MIIMHLVNPFSIFLSLFVYLFILTWLRKITVVCE